jgi:hypothetical protein
MKKIQLAISTVVALIGVAMLLRAGGMDVALPDRSYTVDSAPTPYSTSHAIVQSKPGPAEEQPPTF